MRLVVVVLEFGTKMNRRGRCGIGGVVPDVNAEWFDAHRPRRDDMHGPENSERLWSLGKPVRQLTASADPGKIANASRMICANGESIRFAERHGIRHVERERGETTRVAADFTTVDPHCGIRTNAFEKQKH